MNIDSTGRPAPSEENVPKHRGCDTTGAAVEQSNLQGGFEIRTFIAVAGATEGSKGQLWFYAPIPIFAVGCTVAVIDIAPLSASDQAAAEACAAAPG